MALRGGMWLIFFGPGIDQLRHTFARLKPHLGHQRPDRAPHGVTAQKQGLVRAARPQQPVGEHMAPFGVGAELDFIHRQKVTAHALGHRLDSADPVLRAWRHNALFARDQCHNRGPAHSDNLVVNLARQQAQRQAHHTCPMGQHPLNCVMGFACIGGSKDGHDPR